MVSRLFDRPYDLGVGSVGQPVESVNMRIAKSRKIADSRPCNPSSLSLPQPVEFPVSLTRLPSSIQRVGILFEYASLNGGERSMLAALDQLAARTDCSFVALLAEEGPLVAECHRRGIPVEAITIRTTTKQRVQPDVLEQQLQRLIEVHQLQLLHANSLTMGRILGTVADRLPIPTTSHVRDIMKLNRSAVEHLRQHDALFAVSHATRKHYIEQGIEGSRWHTLYNGVDCDQFQPRPASGFLRNSLGLSENDCLVAAIGQICLRKGQTVVAEAIAQLRQVNPPVHLLLIGERHSTKQESIEFDQSITQTMYDAGIGHRLHRLGRRDDVAEILKEVDILVHAARQEPLGRVLLEAAASGTPIVATDVGGTREILTHRESALLTGADDVQGICSAIQTLKSDPGLRQSLAKSARQMAVSRFQVQHTAPQLLEAWNRVVTSS